MAEPQDQEDHDAQDQEDHGAQDQDRILVEFDEWAAQFALGADSDDE